MDRTKWIDRVFTFDLPEGWLTNVTERLWGTVPRLLAMTRGLQDPAASFQPAGKSSIKQHIGHLIDLEDLHQGRIDDFLERKGVLRAADMNNVKTNEARHNEKTCVELIDAFTQKRNHFVERLHSLDDDTLRVKSLHPRLQVLVRPIDIAYFTAEHDDHHLADIRQLINLKL